MKIIKLNLLSVYVFFFLTILIGCSSEKEEINDNTIKLSVKETQNRISNLLTNSNRLSRTILSNYRTTSDLTLEQIILNEKPNIVAIVNSEFPEFSYDPNMDNNEDFIALISSEGLPQIISDTSLTQIEKDFMLGILNLSDGVNQIEIFNLIQEFKEDIQNLSFNEKERASFMAAFFESVYNYYNPSTRDGCGQAAASGALTGAMVGAAVGFIKGCWTGMFLGFNPGSVAAGCMGGMIVGMVEGALTGAVGGALACELNL